MREHERLIGEAPRGIWLPECAYFEGLDQQLAKAGLRYAILDAHGLLHALPRPRYGVYAPICSPGAVAFFGRDSEATLPVWSASDGYPGTPATGSSIATLAGISKRANCKPLVSQAAAPWASSCGASAVAIAHWRRSFL